MDADIEEIIDRVKRLMEQNDINETELSKSIGIGQRTVNYYLKCERKPSLEFIIKVSSAFPNLNSQWLLTGEGEMFVTSEKKEEKESSPFGLLEVLEKFDVKEERLLTIIESQQRAIETLSMTTKKILAQAEESVTCADAAGSEFRK